MEPRTTNIYKNARQTAGLTQERWAEQLGVTADTVRLYESGRNYPSDEVAARMAEVAGMPVLGYWHLKLKSALANDALPDVARVPLPQAVVGLLAAMDAVQPQVKELLMIARDGIVDAGETELFEDILDDLEDVVTAALAVKYAERS
nr:MAG TPA: helix-turn-helix domain protein [Caudoviricetes sp.]